MSKTVTFKARVKNSPRYIEGYYFKDTDGKDYILEKGKGILSAEEIDVETLQFNIKN